jgi:hypothetical protein
MRSEVVIEGGSSFFKGLSSAVSEYSSTEDATTIDPSNYNGGFGQLTVSALAVQDSKMAQGKIMRLSDSSNGKTTGIVRQVATTDKIVTFTGDSVLGLFNTFHTVGPQIGTLEQAINAYCDVVGISNIVEVNGEYREAANFPWAPLKDLPVKYPGFVGNVWDNIKRIMAAEQIEMALVYDKIVVRPLRTLQANLDRSVSISENVNTQSTAKSVEVYYYPTEVITQGEVFPVQGEDPSILQVDVGETREFTLNLTASLTSVNQPVVMYTVENRPYNDTSGVYAVAGNDGLPIPTDQWLAQGGQLSVRIGDDSSTLIVTVTGASNVALAPYRIAMSSGAGNFYNSLHITGQGTRYTEEMITLTTGATSATTGEEVGATVTNPFIQTLAQAYTAGIRASGTYAGPVYTVSGTALNINRAGGNRDEIRATFLDYNQWWSDTHPGELQFSNFNAAWNGQTFAQFNAFWDERMENLFTNQAFGNAVGARVRADDAFFRIDTATITPRDINFTASLDTLIDDYNNVNGDIVPPSTQTITNYAPNPQARGAAVGSTVPRFSGYTNGDEVGATMTSDTPLDTAILATNYARNPRIVNSSATTGWGYQGAGGETTVYAPSYASENSVSNARTNYCTNPSFESDTTGWLQNQGTLTRTSSYPQMGGRVGNFVAQVTADAGITQTWFGMIQTLAEATPVVAGDWVAVRCWLAHDNATVSKARLQAVLSGTGTTTYRHSTLESSVFYAGGYRDIVFQVPADGTNAIRLQPQVIWDSGSPVAGARLWADQFMVLVGPTENAVRGQLARGYFDGNSGTTYGSYDHMITRRWGGTANNSISHERWSVAPNSVIEPLNLPGFNRRYITNMGVGTFSTGWYMRGVAGDVTGAAGDSMYMSVYLRSSVDISLTVAAQLRSGDTTVSGSPTATAIDLPAGVWTRVGLQSGVATTTFDGFQLWAATPVDNWLPYGEFIDISGGMAELNASALNKFFDYGSPNEDSYGDIRYGHRVLGTLYASPSVRYLTISDVRTFPAPNITSYARRAVTSMRTAGSTGWQSFAATYRGSVTGLAGQEVTTSGWFRYVGPDPVRRFNLRTQAYNSAGSGVGYSDTAVDLKSGEWTRITSTTTATADFLSAGWWLFQFPQPEQIMKPGSVIDATGIMITPAADSGSIYFDGDTPWGNRMSYIWSGTKYASPSVQRLHTAEPHQGQSFAQFNVARAGYTFSDFAITPLRSTDG